MSSFQTIKSFNDNEKCVMLKQRFLIDLFIGALKHEMDKDSVEKHPDSQWKQDSTPTPMTWPVLKNTFFDFYYHITSIEIKITA